jgi:gamma-glutamyltranspeptidase/glutathione hydrolase
MAGPLSTMIFDAKAKRVRYLDGDFNAVLNPDGAWSDRIPKLGKSVLVPGAVAALELMAKDYGKLSFKELLQPAIKLAEDCFKVDRLYAALIISQEPLLKRSEYGKTRFFHKDGTPLKPDEKLCLPEVAGFLKKLAQNGSAYMYAGEWATRAVDTIKAAGGLMSPQDFAQYKAVWREPRESHFQGYRVFGPPGRNIGGLHTMLGLRVLEQTTLDRSSHFSAKADDLETMVRISRYMYHIISRFEPLTLDNEVEIVKWFSDSYVKEMWRQIKRGSNESPNPLLGSHSFHVMAADKDGNVVTGTNTINSLPWGEGLFVEGVPLNAGAKIALKTRPGERTIHERDMHIVLQGDAFKLATGAFNISLMPANFQFLVNHLYYGLSPDDSVSLPRFGGFPLNLQDLTVDITKNYLDPKIPPEVLQKLEKRCLKFEQKGRVDTGDGGVIIKNSGSTFTGAYSPSSIEL